MKKISLAIAAAMVATLPVVAAGPASAGGVVGAACSKSSYPIHGKSEQIKTSRGTVVANLTLRRTKYVPGRLTGVCVSLTPTKAGMGGKSTVAATVNLGINGKSYGHSGRPKYGQSVRYMKSTNFSNALQLGGSIKPASTTYRNRI